MKKQNSVLFLVMLLVLIVVATFAVQPKEVYAGSNGQQLSVKVRCGMSPSWQTYQVKSVRFTGSNQNNKTVTYIYSQGSGTICPPGSLKIAPNNWWWKGNVTVTVDYYNRQSKTCRVNVPIKQISNWVDTTCFIW